MGQLYKLDFPNGKSYIGIAFKCAQNRFERHRRAAIKSESLLYRAWRKHGGPTFKVLAVVEDSVLYETEIKAVAVYKTKIPYGYNMNDGGKGGLNPSPEVRASMSASHIGKPSPRKGVIISPETRAKLSVAHAGKICSPEHHKAVSVAMTGRPCSPETRYKIGATKKGNQYMLGRKHTDETRAKMSKAAQGKIFSPEHRESLRRAWAKRKAVQLKTKLGGPHDGTE